MRENNVFYENIGITQPKYFEIENFLKENDIYFENIGRTQEKYFEIVGEMKIDTNALFKINNQWYNNY